MRDKKLRLPLADRRRRKRVGPPPALHDALRHLRVRVYDTDNAAGLERFRSRAAAVARLADARGFPAVREVLARLVDELASPPLDPGRMIFAALDNAQDLARNDRA